MELLFSFVQTLWLILLAIAGLLAGCLAFMGAIRAAAEDRLRERLAGLGMVALGAVVIALVVVLTACVPGPTQPTNTNQNQTTTIFFGSGPSPSPSPSPAASCASAVKSVRVNPFGEKWDCPAGVVKPPNNAGVLPLGCTAPVTATPKGDPAQFPPNGDVPAEIHGPSIAWALTSGSDHIRVTDDPTQPFNKNVTALSVGEFRLEATVCGVTGAWLGRVQ